MKLTEWLGVLIRGIGVWYVVTTVAPLARFVVLFHSLPNRQELLQMLGAAFGEEFQLTVGWSAFVFVAYRFVRIGWPGVKTIIPTDGDGHQRGPALLGALLKAMGCWELIIAIVNLPWLHREWHAVQSLDAELNGKSSVAGPLFVPPLLVELIMIVVGVCLVLRTDLFMRIAYWGAEPKGEDAPTARNNSRQPARETFAAVLKALGYWELLSGVLLLPYQVPPASPIDNFQSAGRTYLGFLIVAGIFLLSASDAIAEKFYRMPKPGPPA
jgi:hypothetical protein